MNDQKVRPIRPFKVIDVLIPGLVKLLPNYYSRATRCKFAVGLKLYFQVGDDDVIRRFEFTSMEQRETFVDAWKSLHNSCKH